MNGIVPWGARTHNPSIFAGLQPFRQEVNTPTLAPTPPQPTLRDWYRELRGEPAPQAPTMMQSAMTGLRHGGESAGAAALLAFIDTDLGGLDMGGRVPLDAVGAAVFYALSIKDSGLSADYRAVSQSCVSVYTYRMIKAWRESKKGIPRNMPQTSGDPVLSAGKSAGF